MVKNCFNVILMLYIAIFLFFRVMPCFALPNNQLLRVAHDRGSSLESVNLLLSRKSEYKTFHLSHPPRFVIDVKNCYFQPDHSTVEVLSEFIKRIKISQLKKDGVRIVLDKKAAFGATHITTEREAEQFKIMIGLASLNPLRIEHELPTQGHEKKGTIQPVDQQYSKNGEDQNLDALFSVPEQNSILIDARVAEDLSTEKDGSKLILSGDFRNETAYRINKPHHLSKVKNILDMTSSGTLSDNLSYFAGARLAYDAVFDLTDEYNHSVEDDQELNLDLRDAYIDMNLGKFDLRLGNQQIVWGQAVGLFFADIVNPKDLREYILPDLDQIRIPVPAANLESYYNDVYFQVIFIPFPEFNEFGKQGSEFDFSKALYNVDADIILNDPVNPSNSLDNSEIGGRIGWFKNGWDLALFYFYDMYNFPVNYHFISVGTSGTHPVTITYKPEYERIHRIGSTFSKEFRDAIFKGEFIYNSKMFFESSDLSDIDGITKSPSFDWLIGVDYTFFNTLDTNFQIMQNIIMDHDKSMSAKKYSTSFSVWAKTSFFDNRIEPECFFVTSLNQRDGLIRPKVAYLFNNKIKIIIGADLFYGESDGNFGIFSQNDRAYVEILYRF